MYFKCAYITWGGARVSVDMEPTFSLVSRSELSDFSAKPIRLDLRQRFENFIHISIFSFGDITSALTLSILCQTSTFLWHPFSRFIQVCLIVSCFSGWPLFCLYVMISSSSASIC